jgi:formylglycine-generating enzyme required for sulfatase activity
MALIPAGEFVVGSDDEDADEDDRPRHREYLPDFYIDVHEVTNREFQKFDPTRTFPPDEADLPANSITFAQAEAYARSVGKRIPTNEEWEKAARGTDGRRYPWGDTWESKRVAPRRKRPGDKSMVPQTVKGKLCAIGPSRLQKVGSNPSGDSPFGCKDMAGNAWEWVQGFYNNNPRMRILRGGAVGYGERACRTYIRSIEGDADT